MTYRTTLDTTIHYMLAIGSFCISLALAYVYAYSEASTLFFAASLTLTGTYFCYAGFRGWIEETAMTPIQMRKFLLKVSRAWMIAGVTWVFALLFATGSASVSVALACVFVAITLHLIANARIVHTG